VYVRPFVRYLQAEHDFLVPKQPHYLWPTYRQVDADQDPNADQLDVNEDEEDDEEEEDMEDTEQREAISTCEKQGF